MKLIDTYKIGDEYYFDYIANPFTGIVEETGTLYKFVKVGDKCTVTVKPYLKMSVAKSNPVIKFYSIQDVYEDIYYIELGKVYTNNTVYLLEKDLDKVKEIFNQYYQDKIDEYNEKINGLKQKQEALDIMVEK